MVTMVIIVGFSLSLPSLDDNLHKVGKLVPIRITVIFLWDVLKLLVYDKHSKTS